MFLLSLWVSAPAEDGTTVAYCLMHVDRSDHCLPVISCRALTTRIPSYRGLRVHTCRS